MKQFKYLTLIFLSTICDICSFIPQCVTFHRLSRHDLMLHSHVDDSFFSWDLPSGVRGEAVRASIRNPKRGVFYELLNSLHGGIVNVKGEGTIQFLESKLTGGSFRTNTTSDVCLLDSKGKIIDRIVVFMKGNQDAILISSPGHGKELFCILDKLIFPMDKVYLTDMSKQTDVEVFCIGSTTYKNAESIIRQIFDESMKDFLIFPSEGFAFMNKHFCILFGVLPFGEDFLQGYTLVTFNKDWTNKVRDCLYEIQENTESPLQLKRREFETLRIESGVPAYNSEFKLNTNPLELNLKHTLNMDKGCYLGQEQISAVLKNKLGPRRTLYKVCFQEDNNSFEYPAECPQPTSGKEIFVLGSNQEIFVGVITSVAEPGATGKPCTVALALVSRANKILKRMKEMNIKYDKKESPSYPLDGLEIILNNTYTIGKLQAIPPVKYPFGTTIKNSTSQSTSNDSKNSQETLTNQDASQVNKSKEAAAEAERKAEKLKLLQERAQKALLSRKLKKNEKVN